MPNPIQFKFESSGDFEFESCGDFASLSLGLSISHVSLLVNYLSILLQIPNTPVHGIA